MITPVAPGISDHALVRFLQRSGLDVERVRGELSRSLAKAHGAAVALGGADHLIVADGLTYVVRKGVVATVLPDAGYPAGRARALHR